jgi:outer membrane protein assembly factor BamB
MRILISYRQAARHRLAAAPRLAPLASLIAFGLLLGCPPPAVLPTGCGKDTDCKGARICVQHACVDPPRPSPSPAPKEIADGGEPDLLPPPLTDGGTMVSFQTNDPSPMFHGDPFHTGRSKFKFPIQQPKEVMHVATGGVVFSSPAIAEDGTISFTSHDRSIYAAAPDGTIKWRRPTGDLAWSAPALWNGTIYAGSDDDKLYALDPKDGSVRWSYQAGPCRTHVGIGPEAARCDVDGVTVAPDGTIYFSADGLYALNADGALKWKFSPGPTHCAAAPAVGYDGTVYVGCQDDALYAIDPATGNKRWEFRTSEDIDGAPMVTADGTVWFGSDDRKLYALGPGGVLKFAVATGGAIRSSPAQGPNGMIYVGSFDGNLYAIRPTGTIAWTFRTADRILSSPLVDANGNLLIGSEDDRLYALAPDGKLLWSLLLDGDVDSTPALGADGTIYVGCDDRALHAFR